MNEELAALVEAERTCYRFLDWTVGLDAGQPVLRITARPGTPSDIAALTGLFPAA